MSLSSLIVEREIASIREVEEALARQVLYGGDFVTNLLEVCRLDEAALGAVVADFYGLQTAPPGELPVTFGDAARVLAPEVAAQRSITTLSFDASGVVLAVAEPLSREAEQELAFALAVPITQKIAPLVRIRQALARDHGIPIDRRLSRLLGKMTGEAPRLASNPRIPVVAPPPRAPSAPAPAPTPEAPKPRAAGALATLVREATSPMTPFKRRRGPLTLAEAQADLEEAAARDRIFDLVFDFSRQFFDYTAIFLVHGDLAEGRDGWGEGASRERVVRMGVPLDLPSIVSVARAKKAKVRAVAESEGLDAVLLADLGRQPGSEIVALPIVVRTRVVAMIVGDGGEGGLDEAGLAEVDAVVGHAVAAFERLIVRRKLQGTQPPPEVEGGRSPVSKRSRREDNPDLEGAVQVVIARAQIPSVPPAAEELAAPVRELMVEPHSTAALTRREPNADSRESPSPGAVDAPPPAQLLEVRRLSGPPIPREEPDAASEEEEHGPRTRVSGLPDEPAPKTRVETPAAKDERRRSSGAMRKPEAPHLSFEGEGYGAGYGEDPVERRLLAEISGREGAPEASPRAASAPPAGGGALPYFATPRVTDLSPGVMFPPHDPDATPLAPEVADDEPTPRMPPVFPEVQAGPAVVVAPVVSVGETGPSMARSEIADLAEALKRKVSASVPPSMLKRDKPMPASEQQVSVAAHRPPSSHEDVTRVLPSVIVDVEDEYQALVERVLDHDDEEAEADLLRAGPKAMATLMARFPGTITVARSLLEDGVLPRASECGPVLRLVAAQRRIALAHVLDRVESKNDEERTWATYLLGELLYPEAVEAASARVFDENPVVRRVARLALRSLADAHPGAVVDKLGSIAKGREQPTVRRTRAVEALGETREATCVPVLASLVNDTAGAVANAARIALVMVTRQDFGHDSRAWFDWWDENGERHRLEWLMDALLSDSAMMRGAAGEELKTITKEYFGYYDDLPKREREKVQQRYRQWWAEVGRVRFSRSSAPRSSS